MNLDIEHKEGPLSEVMGVDREKISKRMGEIGITRVSIVHIVEKIANSDMNFREKIYASYITGKIWNKL